MSLIERVDRLPDAEQRLLGYLNQKLFGFTTPNLEALAYYEGPEPTKHLNVSVPPRLKDLEVVAGWGGTVVDVLEERLDWLGWDTLDDSAAELDRIYAANRLDAESSQIHVDALTFGVAFATITRGRDGEPDPLILGYSPLQATGVWNKRRRQLDCALVVTDTDGAGQASRWTLFLPDRTIWCVADGSDVLEVARDEHHQGVVPVVMFANRPRASREYGRSEITRAVRYYTDAAIRTLLGLETRREYYNNPQRVAKNLPEDAFTDSDGKPVNPWVATQGAVWAIPPNNDGLPEPEIFQLDQATPAPYFEQIRSYQTLIAAESGIPEAYFGIYTANPSSEAAIRALEDRLVKRAQRRQESFGRAWLSVAEIALRITGDGELPDWFKDVRCRWRDPATPTRSGQADAATKIIDKFPWLADTEVGLELAGLDADQIARALAEKSKASALGLLDAITAAPDEVIEVERGEV